MAIFIRDSDQKAFDELALKLDEIRRAGRWSLYYLSSAARIKPTTLKQLIYTGRGNILSLVRILEATGHDIVFVKRAKAKPLFEIQGAAEQLHKLKKTELNAKQRERYARQSKREQLENLEREQDFLADD